MCGFCPGLHTTVRGRGLIVLLVSVSAQLGLLLLDAVFFAMMLLVMWLRPTDKEPARGGRLREL